MKKKFLYGLYRLYGMFGLVFLGITGLLSGCASTTVKEKMTYAKELTVYVIDENNKPVDGFFLECKEDSESGKWNGFSDGDGIWIIEGAKKGKYFLKGKKNGYVPIENTEIIFSGEETFFCKTASCNFILNEALKLYEKNNYEAGLKKLNQLYVTGDTVEAATVCFYRAVAYRRLGKKKKFIEEYERFQNFTALSNDFLKTVLLQEDENNEKKSK